MPKNYLLKTLAICIISSCLFYGNLAHSEVMACVDENTVYEKSTASQKIRDAINKKAEEMTKEYKGKETALKKKAEDFEKQRSVLSEDALEKKSNEISKEWADLQNKFHEGRAVLDKGFNDAMQKLRPVVEEVVKSEAEKVGAVVVFDKGQLMYIQPSLDITAAVVDGVNKKIPSIPVSFK